VTIPALYQLFKAHPSVQTDTRKLKKGDLYFALKGPNYNGNQFAAQALEAGAAYAIVDEAEAVTHPNILLFDDVLATLQALAKHHREQFDIPFIAITGSNGKTTSKELIYAVLSAHYKTYTTVGNLNNHIGVPLTILSVKPDAEMAVIEMGANHQREIAGYCTYTLPNYGIITNCGKAHLEGFGGIEGVRKGKGELYDFLGMHNGTAFVYADYDYLQKMQAVVKHVVQYGQTAGELQGQLFSNDPFLAVSITKGITPVIIQSLLVGDYNLPNILCAVCVGAYFKVPEEKIKKAIESYHPTNSRSQLIHQKGHTIILDAYNANPTSMKAAIENFAHLQAPNKILMLGGMMELGEESLAEHAAIIAVINQYSWQSVILVGGDFGKVVHEFTYFPTSVEAKAWFQHQQIPKGSFLIKGSRSMQMEKILEP
jgi:UDP-N-acetylmuramoyl-tripeptide--D-alanyl-D-alanine ligase